MKKLFKASVLVISIILLLILSFIFPIKFCLTEFPSESDGEFYIVRYDSTKNWWIFMGDKNGMLDWNIAADIPVTINGVDLTQILSADLWFDFQKTYFVIWGKGEEHTSYDEIEPEHTVAMRSYSVDCNHWDILGEFSTHNSFRNNFSRKYLTIYDYKWFDDLRMYDPIYKWM